MDFRFLLYISICFIVYSLIGWIYESILKTIVQKKIVNSGFLFGPFCPIYGMGAVIMLIFLDWLKGNNTLLFITAFFILSLWEYLVGWGLEKIFNTKYWDYSNFRFNIKGRICLQASLVWAAFSLIFINFFHPFMDKTIILVDERTLVFITGIILFYLIIDTIISVIKVNNINIRLQKLSEIGDSIKEKLEELAKQTEKNLNLEKLQSMIDELKQVQIDLKLKLEKQTSRLKKAFPKMQAQIKQKRIEVREKIEKVKNKRSRL